MILLAILFPAISFFVRGKILIGILCIVLQLTIFGWLPAAIWAVVSYSNEKTQKKLNKIEKSISQNHSSNKTYTANANSGAINDLSDQAHRFYDQQDYYSAIGILQRMILLNPHEGKNYFNLACCYSLTENKEGFNALSRAVEHGYTNFEKIKIYKALQWLRDQPEFDQFIKNGYRLFIDTAKDIKSKTEPINDDVFTKIEKLGKLKEQGFITEEEFQEQKKKLL